MTTLTTKCRHLRLNRGNIRVPSTENTWPSSNSLNTIPRLISSGIFFFQKVGESPLNNLQIIMVRRQCQLFPIETYKLSFVPPTPPPPATRHPQPPPPTATPTRHPHPPPPPSHLERLGIPPVWSVCQWVSMTYKEYICTHNK